MIIKCKKQKHQNKHMTTPSFESNCPTINGSITVEASFVMPFILLCIFALIYLSFYLQDKNRIQTVTDASLIKASFYFKHRSDLVTGRVDYTNIDDRGVFYMLTDTSPSKEEVVEKLIIAQLTGKLLLLSVKDIKVNVNHNKITAAVSADSEIPIPFITQLFKPYSLTVISEDYPMHNPAESIRCMEVILETGSKVKGISQLQDKLNQILR